jgi:hypothetical protein
MRVDIVLLLFDRPDHSLSVIDSLVRAGVKEVSAFMDHSEDAAVKKRQDELIVRMRERRAIHVKLQRHREHLGLARSIRHALDRTLDEADAAIVLEDDCVVRPGAIDFFRQGLESLRYDNRIRSLCGYLFPCPFVRSGAEPLLLRRFCTWGWATWRDRWREFDPSLPRVIERLSARGTRVEDVGADLAELCRSSKYLEGRADIWSVNWILEHYATGTYCVYPSDSMIENIGFDGSGKNCLPTTDFATEVATSMPSSWSFAELFHCTENEDMLKAFMTRHGLKTYPSEAP